MRDARLTPSRDKIRFNIDFLNKHSNISDVLFMTAKRNLGYSLHALLILFTNNHSMQKHEEL